jgi:hypothetical protein
VLSIVVRDECVYVMNMVVFVQTRKCVVAAKNNTNNTERVYTFDTDNTYIILKASVAAEC